MTRLLPSGHARCKIQSFQAMKLLRNGGAGLIALLCRIFLESSSLGLIAQLALGSNSIADKGLVTRKCCAMFRRRASRCVPCAEHRARASARNFPIRSSSSDHMSSPSFRELFLCPLHGLLSPTTQDVLMSRTVNQQHPRSNSRKGDSRAQDTRLGEISSVSAGTDNQNTP